MTNYIQSSNKEIKTDNIGWRTGIAKLLWLFPHIILMLLTFVMQK